MQPKWWWGEAPCLKNRWRNSRVGLRPGPIRRVDLARRLEAKFNVKLHQRTVGTYLAKLGFRRLSVRPEHPDADPAAQTSFKKTLPVS